MKNSKNNAQKNVINLTNQNDASQKFIEAKKESIKNDTKIENLDFLNLSKKVASLKVKETISKDVQKMYKFERLELDAKQQKRLRTKIRNQRNKFANNIILLTQKNNLEEVKKEVAKFNVFYKETYLLNDYSLISISSNNRDKETEVLLTYFLEVVKCILTFK